MSSDLSAGRFPQLAATSTAARTRTINIRIEEERRALIERVPLKLPGRTVHSSFWTQRLVRRQLSFSNSAYQKQGLGSALLKDALLRTTAAAQIAGIRAVLLRAMADDARRFHERAGCHECPVDSMMMMITPAEVEKNLSPSGAS